ncbi:bifunctional transcriptional activator/DNA repair enzyme AdaA [Marinicrinis lubricantis]|uniref:Bifunctional transcriptional activator/DNA repair enzyme AdaA n=1 Tax=Marinicrinis lubricantis TaxID=2086470 RepID=A0ABW1INH4_9BACL
MLQLTEEMWNAIIENDASYDGQFIYAVQSTGIFCKPSCKSRIPRREHVHVFDSAKHALDARFRPCKRCRPTERISPEQEWIEGIAKYIEHHFSKPLTLHTLAEISHSSPYHMQRTFKRMKGMTPNEYIRKQRIEHAARLIIQSKKTVLEIAEHVGMPNLSYFITVFKKEMGCTPSDYRQMHQGHQSV